MALATAGRVASCAAAPRTANENNKAFDVAFIDELMGETNGIELILYDKNNNKSKRNGFFQLLEPPDACVCVQKSV